MRTHVLKHKSQMYSWRSVFLDKIWNWCR